MDILQNEMTTKSPANEDAAWPICFEAGAFATKSIFDKEDNLALSRLDSSHLLSGQRPAYGSKSGVQEGFAGSGVFRRSLLRWLFPCDLCDFATLRLCVSQSVS